MTSTSLCDLKLTGMAAGCESILGLPHPARPRATDDCLGTGDADIAAGGEVDLMARMRRVVCWLVKL